MIVYNWPERCPGCGHRGFDVTTREDARIVRASGWTSHGAELAPNLLRCICRDPACRHKWQVELATTTPFVFRHPKILPLAVVAPTLTEAEELVALGPEWRADSLPDLIRRGSARVDYVLAAERSSDRPTSDVSRADAG